MTQSDIKGMATAALVALYNQLTGKNIKKFSSRSAGEAQVLKAQSGAGMRALAASARVTEGATAAPTRKRSSIGLSAGVKNSWGNAKTRAARKERTHVLVNGAEYRSVSAAFTALKLPMAKVIRFRMALKGAEGGRLAFEHDGKSVMFTCVEKVA